MVYSFSVNNFQYNNYNTVTAVRATSIDKKCSNPIPQSNSQTVSFSTIPFTASNVRTSLSSKEEKNKYNEIVKIADKDTKKRIFLQQVNINGANGKMQM